MLQIFVEKLTSLTLAKAELERPETLKALAPLFLQAYPEAKLSRYTEEELAERILVAYQVLEVREKGEVKIEVREGDGLVLLFVNTEDQPFLLDTVKLQMERLEVTYDLYIHPVVTVNRDDDGRVRRVAPSWDEGPKEPLILFETRLDEERIPGVVERLREVLLAAKDVVGDFVRMKRRLREAINDLEFYRELKGDPQGDLEEVNAFLEWLYNEHYVFFGSLYLEEEGKHRGGLGICRPQHSEVPGLFSLNRLKKRLLRHQGLFWITKGENPSQIYHKGRLDVIVVRSFSEDGNPRGWHLFFGLYAKGAYGEKADGLPLLRLKLQRILQSIKVVAGSYDYKRVIMLYNILPLEELLISPAEEIQELITSILHAGPEESCVVLQRLRKEYLALLVVLTQERYSARLEEEIKDRLGRVLKAEEVENRLLIYEQTLAFLWFFIYGEALTLLDGRALEEEINQLSRSWEDSFKTLLGESYPPEDASALFHRYGGIFPQEYKAITPSQEAVVDLLYLEQVRETGEIQASFHQEEKYTRIKLFAPRELTLSATVPVLENMDLTVLDEVPLRLERGKEVFYIHSYRVTSVQGDPVFEEVWYNLTEAIKAVMSGAAESDPLNRLVVREDLDWRIVDLFRAYRNYLRQIAPQFLPQSVTGVLLAYPRVARALWNYFDAKFNPAHGETDGGMERSLEVSKERFEKTMEEVEHLSDDLLLRVLFNLVEATIRTNFYRKDKLSHYISFKIYSPKVLHMPFPRPMYEIYIHDREMEGIHLRGGKVARGGIRWSDRPDDFRREILGLMKTQMVKNALIIPVGAKGGFVVKDPHKDRGAAAQLAAEKYRILIRGMLDITDNVVEGKMVHPPQVVRHDGDDSYLVVAADKGTAHLSDVANRLAKEYGFWLGDAFASGGSAGYSHKDLGITAKGAWVCVRRHFMETGVDPEKDIIRVVGIGDMGGDVFGNGMLLSKTIKLVGAFNHIHIFLDPDPDPEVSWQERNRLFKEGKGWDAYNPQLISPGGGVYFRDAKAVTLTPQVKALLDTDKGEVSGEELVKLLLKAPVDLLWNGGIGTYVKASNETNQEVGDTANDSVRVDAKDLRAKVVGEGGNLGFTQKARVEFALEGGGINTDALDNSGGVDLSDHEVNIKVLLQDPVKRRQITLNERNVLLKDVVSRVVEAVLYDSYRQSLAVSLDVMRSEGSLEPFQWVIGKLVESGILDRRAAFIPTEQEFVARRKGNKGLTKPELALLLGYEKLWVKNSLRGCPFIQATYLNDYLERYFPSLLKESFREEIVHHLLRDEILLTIITNTIVNQSGLAFFARMLSELEAHPGEVAASYMVMEGVMGAPPYRQAIYDLDFNVPAQLQYQSLLDMEETLEVLVRWSLFFIGDWLPLKEVIEKYRSQVDRLVALLLQVLPEDLAQTLKERKEGFVEDGLPEDLARVRASLPHLASAMDLFTLGEALGEDMESLAPLYYQVIHLFQLDRIFWEVKGEEKADHWEVLAYTYLEKDLWQVIRDLVKKALPLWKTGLSAQKLEVKLQEKVPLAVDRLREMRSWIDEEAARGLSAWTVALRRLKEALV